MIVCIRQFLRLKKLKKVIPGKYCFGTTNIFNEWNISNKIVTIVSDNGANIKHAINDHLLKYHHPCVAHTLNLSLNESINQNTEFLRVLKIFRAIVGHFKHSNLATEKLK